MAVYTCRKNMCLTLTFCYYWLAAGTERGTGRQTADGQDAMLLG